LASSPATFAGVEGGQAEGRDSRDRRRSGRTNRGRRGRLGRGRCRRPIGLRACNLVIANRPAGTLCCKSGCYLRDPRRAAPPLPSLCTPVSESPGSLPYCRSETDTSATPPAKARLRSMFLRRGDADLGLQPDFPGTSSPRLVFAARRLIGVGPRAMRRFSHISPSRLTAVYCLTEPR